jgi:UDP-N-acetylmuramate--alanine ligase
MKFLGLGIGGTGMSALTRFFLTQKIEVFGTDKDLSSNIVKSLKKEGVKIIKENDDLPKEIDCVFYTDAISKDHPLLKEALKNNILAFSYFQILGKISEISKTIAVSGTHGKSTITAILGETLYRLGKDPLIILGANMPFFANQNICLPQKTKFNFNLEKAEFEFIGERPFFVVEACEYKENFLHLNPDYLLINNCEYDHHDYYQTFEDYKLAFLKFARQIDPQGKILLNYTCSGIKEIFGKNKLPISKLRPDKIKDLNLLVKGEHNQLNAKFVFLSLQEILKENKQKILLELKKFKGIERRFEVLGLKNNLLIIDDYGHHPSELKYNFELLLKTEKTRDLYVVFQFHQYTRTKKLYDDFIKVFNNFLEEAKKNKRNLKIIITDIYEARDTEENKKNVNPLNFVKNFKDERIAYLEFDKIFDYLSKQIKKPALLFTSGAGETNLLAKNFLKNF